MVVGLDGVRGEVDDRARRRVDPPLRKPDRLRDLAAEVVDLTFEDAVDAAPARARAREQLLVGDIEDLHVGREHLARAREAAEDDRAGPAELADGETSLLVDGLDIAPADLLEQITHPLPGDDTQVLRLLEAGDQQVGDRLAQVIVRGIARAVLEGDRGDRFASIGENVVEKQRPQQEERRGQERHYRWQAETEQAACAAAAPDPWRAPIARRDSRRLRPLRETPQQTTQIGGQLIRVPVTRARVLRA